MSPYATVYTDGSTIYKQVPQNREVVRHDLGEYVRGDVHTNGIESFWAIVKRAHKGTYHSMSPKHMHRYAAEFAGRHNVRDKDTLARMRDVVTRMIGRSLTYRYLVS